jgi:hypothetical protein
MIILSSNKKVQEEGVSTALKKGLLIAETQGMGAEKFFSCVGVGFANSELLNTDCVVLPYRKISFENFPESDLCCSVSALIALIFSSIAT